MSAKLLLLAIAALPLVSGCNNANSAPEDTLAAPETVVEAAVPVSAAEANLPSKAVVPEGKVVNTNLTVPESVKLSPAATEIAKMARAGVATSVMMAYVQSSVNTYSLAAEEIVYLNDLGVHPDVVSAMIGHDQQIREASVNGAVAAAPATPAPGASVWNGGTVTEAAGVWQETAAAPAAEADVQTTVPPPPAEERPAEVTVNYFYDSLSPYGTWIEIPGYGYCWRPTVAVTYSGWRPYVNAGRWLWTDCGWYWYSDYSWGWAPFHYGRWFSHPHWGWCWVPGTVWGPSWVSWRYTDGYCGWAPLPPAAYYSPRFGFTYYGRSCGVGFTFGLTWDCFTFVSYNNFCGRHYDRHHVGRHDAARIYNNSTVINNVIVGDNNTIINQGIPPNQITARTRNEIAQANVRTTRGGHHTIDGRQESLAADGSAVSVVRHEVPGHLPPTRGGSHPAGTPTQTVGSSSQAAPAAMNTIRGNDTRPGRASGTTRAVPAATRSSAASGPVNPVTPTTSSTTTPSSIANANPTTRTGAPTRSERPRTGGALIIRESRVISTPSSSTAAAAAPHATSSSATPWLKNSTPSASPTTRSSSSTWQSTVPSTSSADSSTVRPGRTAGSTVVRIGSDPRSSSPRYQSSQSPGGNRPQSVVAPSQPSTVRSSISPRSSTTRVESPTRTTRSWNNNNSTVRSTPSYSTPPASQPTTIRPPTRSVSQPAPSYAPPTRSPVSRIGSTPPMRSTPAVRSTSPPSQTQSAPRSSPPANRGNSSSGSGPARPGR